MLKKPLLASLLSLLLCACAQQAAPPTAAQITAAENARPFDTEISAIYQRSCISCHTTTSSKAPLVGFAPDWQARLPQGMDVLIQHVRDGYKAMPAKGFCSDCSNQDFKKLIEFMSTPVAANQATKE